MTNSPAKKQKDCAEQPYSVELAHLVSLMEPPYLEAWKAYCWDKARRLATEDAERFACLPALLVSAMKKPESVLPTSGRDL